MKGNKGGFAIDEMGKWLWALIILTILIIIIMALAHKSNNGLEGFLNLFRFGVS